jgi:hypothetical protein
MKWATFTVCVMALGAIPTAALAANDLVKCRLIDVRDKSIKSLTLEIKLHVKRSTGAGRPILEEGPMLLERQWEIAEPHRWLGLNYNLVRIDDLGILGVSDHNWGNENKYGGATFFYFDRQTGHAQREIIEGADKMPITEIGTCEVVSQ